MSATTSSRAGWFTGRRARCYRPWKGCGRRASRSAATASSSGTASGRRELRVGEQLVAVLAGRTQAVDALLAHAVAAAGLGDVVDGLGAHHAHLVLRQNRAVVTRVE